MEIINKINHAAKHLFLITGTLIFISVFFLKNDMYLWFFPDMFKMSLYILDLPFLFFTLVYFVTRIKMNNTMEDNLVESFLIFFSIIVFTFIIFFHIAFPDLV